MVIIFGRLRHVRPWTYAIMIIIICDGCTVAANKSEIGQSNQSVSGDGSLCNEQILSMAQAVHKD